MLSYYGAPGVREICHALKGHNRKEAVKQIADYLISTGGVGEGDFLLPAPQHDGIALYTREIADMVAKATGASVWDVLRCNPHTPVYRQKARGQTPTISIYRTDRLPQGRLFFVDNVLATGTTFRAAQSVCEWRLLPLIYAIDEGAYKAETPP